MLGEDPAERSSLVQVGFGPPVYRVVQGEKVDIPTSMRRMVVRFPQRHGWPAGPHKAAVVLSELSRYVSEHALDDFVPRQDDSVSFLAHESCVDTLLKASGRNGVFIKTQGSNTELELLWLPDSDDLTRALSYNSDESVLGLAEKGGESGRAPRYALRFRDQASLVRFASAHHVAHQAELGRWKLSGLPRDAGLVGIASILKSRGWKFTDILYYDNDHAVYLSNNRGDDGPLFFERDGQAHQLKFKAVNAVARGMARDASLAQRSATSSAPASSALAPALLSARCVSQAAWLASMAPTTPRDRRPRDEHTGATPDAQRQRTEAPPST